MSSYCDMAKKDHISTFSVNYLRNLLFSWNMHYKVLLYFILSDEALGRCKIYICPQGMENVPVAIINHLQENMQQDCSCTCYT